MKFINMNDVLNRWSLDKVVEIITKTKDYCDAHNLKDVELYEIEDNSWADIDNQRIDIEIRYYKNNALTEQKLLLLKGEVIDGKEFHERFEEFYPKKGVYV